jgi:hypothetical protein
VAESKPQARDLRRIGVSQSELNSYFAYLIDLQSDQPLKVFFLKLYDKNRVEGKIHIDLQGQNLPKILRPEMNFFFEGDIEIKDNKIRIKLKKLYLEQQPIKPMVLDLVIMIAAKVSGSDSGSINDWYPLPYGIDDIRIQMGRAVFLY